MGKESRLRNYKPGETRQQYSNGDRKLYDRDKPISGTDENVWHLMLMFEQKLEEDYGESLIRPVAYTELYHRVAADPDLTSVLDRATIHTSSKGEGGKPLVTSGTKVTSRAHLLKVIDKVTLIERMIELYFYSYESNSLPNINNFCNYNVFNNLKTEVVNAEYLRLLHSQVPGKVVKEEEPPKPDRRDKDTQEVLDITVNRVYTEDQMEEAFARFREGHK